MTIGVSGPFSRQLLADIARYQVAGHARDGAGRRADQMMGYLNRNIRIWVDADKLVATGVDGHRHHVGAQEAARRPCPAAQLDTGGRAFDVRVMGEAPDLETLRNIVVRSGSGSPVRLQDVALVQDGFEDVTTLARSNGAPVQAMGILKQPGSNAVGVAKRGARARSANLQKTLPAGHEARRHLRHHRLHQGVGQRDRHRARARGAAHRARLLAVPRLALVDDERALRDPDVAARDHRGPLLRAASRSTRSRCSGCRSRSGSSSTTR